MMKIRIKLVKLIIQITILFGIRKILFSLMVKHIVYLRLKNRIYSELYLIVTHVLILKKKD